MLRLRLDRRQVHSRVRTGSPGGLQNTAGVDGCVPNILIGVHTHTCMLVASLLKKQTNIQTGKMKALQDFQDAKRSI